MDFCPKCGSLLRPQRKKGKIFLVCPRCGYKKTIQKTSQVYRTVRRIEHKPTEKTIVIEKEEKILAPKVKAICPRCGYKEAYVYEQQTRSADEPATRFFICVKCGYRWREYQ